MRKVFFTLIVILLSTTSCTKTKNKKPEVQEKPEEIIERKKEFIVKMNYKTNKEDVFKYTLSNLPVDDEFQSKSILINEKVSPTSNYELTTANFGVNISNNLRINFGNKKVKDIKIEYISIFYGDKGVKINSNELRKYFVFNKYINLDTLSGTIKTKKIGNNYNPTIALKTNSINFLIKEQ